MRLFDSGEVVQHRYGQRMTVYSFQQEKNVITCDWFDPMGLPHRGQFASEDFE